MSFVSRPDSVRWFDVWRSESGKALVALVGHDLSSERQIDNLIKRPLFTCLRGVFRAIPPCFVYRIRSGFDLNPGRSRNWIKTMAC